MFGGRLQVLSPKEHLLEVHLLLHFIATAIRKSRRSQKVKKVSPVSNARDHNSSEKYFVLTDVN